MTSSPPGTARVIWILTRTGLRRWLSRFGSQMWPGKKRGPGAAPRGATPRKRRAGRALLGFVGAMWCVGALSWSAQFLAKATAALEDEHRQEGVIRVSAAAYRELVEAEVDLTRLAAFPASAEDARGRRPEDLRRERLEELRKALQKPSLHQQSLGPEEREARANELVRVFADKGAAGFKARHDPRAAAFGGDLWPGSAARPLMLRVLGLALFLLALCEVFTALGMSNQDLGAVSWSLEWLFTFPVRTRGLFLAKALEYALVNPFAWLVTFPFLLVVFLAAGFGWWSVPWSLLASLASFLTLGSLRVVAETWLRKSLSTQMIKNLQALSTVLGMLLFAGIFWVALTPTVPAPFIEAARALPEAALWNPFSLPALLCGEGGAPPLAAGLLILSPLVFAGAGAALSERFVRDGLLISAGASAGRRAPLLPGPPRRERLPPGIVGKEILLVLRDRNRLVQALILPLFMVGVQVVISPKLLASVAADFHHAATLAFAVGSWMLVFSAFQVLTLEGNALWILFTLPRDLHAVFLRKTVLWCALASFYAALILIAGAFSAPAFGLDEAAIAFLTIAGVGLHAFIAAGLGVLAADPLETEAARKVNPVVMYLYLAIAALFANVIYAPSPWTQLAQIVLSSVLAFALWQKVRDRLPYLLDPTEAPPPRISLADGLMVALAFFVLQGLFVLLFVTAGFPRGASLFYGFALGGALVALFSFYVFWRLKVPRLLEAVGLAIQPEAFPRSLLAGIAGSALAVGIGLLYLKAVEVHEPLRKLKEETLTLKDAGPEAMAWVALLAVLAAPLFEEYIFRGLVYRGLRRSAGVLPSVLLSAALFAIVHPPISVIPVFFLGVLCALTMERAGNLLAPVLVHALYNAAMVAAN